MGDFRLIAVLVIAGFFGLFGPGLMARNLNKKRQDTKALRRDRRRSGEARPVRSEQESLRPHQPSLRPGVDFETSPIPAGGT